MLWIKQLLKLEIKLSKKEKEEIFCIWFKKDNLIVSKILKDNRLKLKLTQQDKPLDNLLYFIMLQEQLPFLQKLKANFLFLTEIHLVQL
jgi:hypothetical protein